MISFKKILADTLHVFYPSFCMGCGSDTIIKDQLLCLSCLHLLPHTKFAGLPHNSLEKMFSGRMDIEAAHSEFYFTKGKLVQHLIHQLKYKNNKDIGKYLGEIMGHSLLQSLRFCKLDYIIPLPLYPDKEFKRGYNQSEIICNGIASILSVPVLNNNVLRQRATETQTRKRRTERWQNVSDSFVVSRPGELKNKKILLVDDVVTTGASLEACGQAIIAAPISSLSIATLAIASK